jgi:proline iminopeptidase
MYKLLSPLLLLTVALPSHAANYKIDEGYVDANGLMIYYTSFGQGPPLLIVHGGPGASHDYFLPYLIPLARHNRLVFIDERGSGKSQKLDNPAGYTVRTWWKMWRLCAGS